MSKLRRYAITFDGFKRVGNVASINIFQDLLRNRNCTSIKVITTESEIERVKSIYEPYIRSAIELPVGKEELKKWILNPREDVTSIKNHFFLSEWLNQFAMGSKIQIVSDGRKYEFEIYTLVAIDENDFTEIHNRIFPYKVLSDGKVVVSDTVGFFTSDEFVIFDSFDDFSNRIESVKTEVSTWSLQKCLKAKLENGVHASLVNLNEAELDLNSNIDCWNLLNELVMVGESFCITKEIVEKIFTHFKPTKNIENAKPFLRKLQKDLEWTIKIQDQEVNVKYIFTENKIIADKGICPKCGNICTEEWTLPSGEKVCSSCLKNKMRSQESTRMLGYHTRTISNVQRSCGALPSEKSRYGFELEMILKCQKGSTDFYNNWLPKWYDEVAPIIYGNGNIAKLERDGSLGSNGEELISQPLNKEFILSKKMEDLLKACEELYTENECCGLHIHVDKDALTPKQWGILLRFFTVNYQHFVDAGIFRPTKHYNDLSFLRNAIQRYKEEELYNYFVSNVGHYSSVSFSRSTGGKTIEFRCFDSTVKYDKFINNLKVIMMLLDNVDKFVGIDGIQFTK